MLGRVGRNVSNPSVAAGLPLFSLIGVYIMGSHAHTHMHADTHRHAQTDTVTHTHAHTCTHMHTHTQVEAAAAVTTSSGLAAGRDAGRAAEEAKKLEAVLAQARVSPSIFPCLSATKIQKYRRLEAVLAQARVSPSMFPLVVQLLGKVLARVSRVSEEVEQLPRLC